MTKTIPFVIIFLLFFSQRSRSITFSSDKESLKQIKNAIDASSVRGGSCIASWDFSVDPCDNLNGKRFTCGFQCDQQSPAGAKRVTELTLEAAGYSGTLSPAVGNLPLLTSLQLSGNIFRGPIPSSIANLPNLQRLTLSRNAFTGGIPQELGRMVALQELYLDNNQLSGGIPASFSELRSLQRLELQGNNLSGQFPDFGALQNLHFLDASDNQISGMIPASLPPSLIHVSMRNNYLEGNIPWSIGELPYLQVMDFSHNGLSGWIPAVAFEHPSLQQLTLSYNDFWGIIPPVSFGTRSELVALDLKNNRLVGFLPLYLAMMPKLSAVSLENNLLTGMIPPSYAERVAATTGAQPFARLLLAGNYLFGPIPAGLLGLKAGDVAVSLGDNCLFRCPGIFFFCQGARQKPLSACRSFNPGIPLA